MAAARLSLATMDIPCRGVDHGHAVGNGRIHREAAGRDGTHRHARDLAAVIVGTPAAGGDHLMMTVRPVGHVVEVAVETVAVRVPTRSPVGSRHVVPARVAAVVTSGLGQGRLRWRP